VLLIKTVGPVMKISIPVLALALLLHPACRRHIAAPVDKPIAPEPTAESLHKCPNGHTTLKVVPISYGLPPFEGEAAKEWKKRVENLEFVPGGCCVSSDSPKSEVICTTCRFAHSISSTGRTEDGYWTRISPNSDSFPQPISEVARSFPVPAEDQLKGSVSFTQSLSDTLKNRYESVSYVTTENAPDVKNEIDKWLNVRGITCNFSSKTHTSTLDGAVRDILRWETDQLYVSIWVQHEHSDDTSSIDATFWNRPYIPPKTSGNHEEANKGEQTKRIRPKIQLPSDR